jgi:hypothetical protein
MPVDQFIGFARQRAMDQTADLTPGMQRAGNEAKLSAFADQTIEEFRKNGILAVKNPVTNQVIPLLNLQTGQQVSQAQGPQLNVTGLDQTFGMNINPLTSPPPQYAQQPGATGEWGNESLRRIPMGPLPTAGGAPTTPTFNPLPIPQTDWSSLPALTRSQQQSAQVSQRNSAVVGEQQRLARQAANQQQVQAILNWLTGRQTPQPEVYTPGVPPQWLTQQR